MRQWFAFARPVALRIGKGSHKKHGNQQSSSGQLKSIEFTDPLEHVVLQDNSSDGSFLLGRRLHGY